MDETTQSLDTLKHQLEAWDRHLERFGLLAERKRFIHWLTGALSHSELALLIDAEIDRRSLWEIHLTELFGP